MDRPLPFVVWPRCALQPTEYNAGFDPQSGGSERLSLTGRMGTSSLSRGIWRPNFSALALFKQFRVNIWKALGAQIGGRNMPILVPYYHFGFGPFLDQQDSTDFSDGSTFSDGTSFAGFKARASVGAAAIAGGVTVTINKDYCGEIQSGHVFSIDGRLYEVRFVQSQDDDHAVVEVQPELRVDIAVGEYVNFDSPSVFCRLVDPQTFRQEIFNGKSGSASIEFIEDTTPIIGG